MSILINAAIIIGITAALVVIMIAIGVLTFLFAVSYLEAQWQGVSNGDA
jgi:hypothetical protein